jgi:UDP-glucose 4-epimerase
VYDNFDSYYSGKEANIHHNTGNSKFTVVEGDILDYGTLSTSMKGVDVVFHLAAQPGIRFSMENPLRTIEVNILGTLNVLRAMEKYKVKKAICASSSSVYGNPKYMPVDELHPTNPISPYSASKLIVETLCRTFYEELNLPIVILRYFTVYGPRQRPDMALSKWTSAMFEGKTVTVYGNGNQTRDFTYIDDVIRGTIMSAEAEGVEGEIFNIGSGSRVSINEVVKMLVEITGVTGARIENESQKVGDVMDTHSDMTKAKLLLGFNSTTDIRDGLQRFVKWYAKNRRVSGS